MIVLLVGFSVYPFGRSLLVHSLFPPFFPLLPLFHTPFFLEHIFCRGESYRAYVSFFDCSSRTSSGMQRGNRLQLGQRAAIWPASGGGGISSDATFNAWAMAALVLARS